MKGLAPSALQNPPTGSGVCVGIEVGTLPDPPIRMGERLGRRAPGGWAQTPLSVYVTSHRRIDLCRKRGISGTYHGVLRGLDTKLIHEFADFSHTLDEVDPYYLTIALDLGRGPRDGVDDPHLLWGVVVSTSGELARETKGKGDDFTKYIP